MTSIAFVCEKCGVKFISTSNVFKTAERQLYRAGWVDEIRSNNHVDRICPKCLTYNKEGNMKAWREEIETITSEMERNGSKLDAAMGKAKHSIYRAVATLRVAGLPKNATEGECNYCGNTFPISSLVAAVRGEVPVVVCSECAREANLEIL